MSFPRFSELPLELQDQVWEFCIPVPSPVAHFARVRREGYKTFERTIDGQQNQQASLLMRDRAPNIDAEPYRGLDRPGALRTLLNTTNRSRAVALRHPDAMDPVESVLLADSDIPNSENDDPSWTPLRVNTATDLVILGRRWIHLAINYKGLNRMGLQCPEPLRYIAMANYHENEVDIEWTRLLNLYGIRVLYILLQPDELRDREQPWEDNLNTGVLGKGDISLEKFLAVYTEGRIRPGPFRCGRREYFEIPAQQIRSLGGLTGFIEKLESNRVRRAQGDDALLVDNMKAMAEGKPDTMDGMEPTRFRFMTWRDV